MFIAALFAIAKTWKQTKYPLTDEWIKKIWYTYTEEYYTAIKKKEVMPFAATWIDLDRIILSEVSQTEKDKYHIIPNMWESKKVMQLNLFIKLKQTHSHRKQTYGYQRGMVGERDSLGLTYTHCALSLYVWIYIYIYTHTHTTQALSCGM